MSNRKIEKEEEHKGKKIKATCEVSAEPGRNQEIEMVYEVTGWIDEEKITQERIRATVEQKMNFEQIHMKFDEMLLDGMLEYLKKKVSTEN